MYARRETVIAAAEAEGRKQSVGGQKNAEALARKFPRYTAAIREAYEAGYDKADADKQSA
jgi:hypothetical protein